uniref:G-protein coupled receptors family 3 profile domain-containing protein n=1 Tax=Heterosigma akashiwo TaxID=2829 RepID=A0A7S3Y1L5_HETAK
MRRNSSWAIFGGLLSQVLFWTQLKLANASISDSDVIVVEGAGASFPVYLYDQAFFAYLSTSEDHVDEEEDLSGIAFEYIGKGSGKGKCRIMDHATECDEDDDTHPILVDFAGSDSLLKEANYAEYPDLQMYPTVAGAVVPIYNLDHVLDYDEELVLTMKILAEIFTFNITSWADQAILDENPGTIAAKLANMTDSTIEVAVRKTYSGTTEIFTKALADACPSFAAQVGGSSLPDWVASPNLHHEYPWQMGAYVNQVPGAIGYLVLAEADLLGLPYAKIHRENDVVVKASYKSVYYAAAELGASFGNTGENSKRLTANLFGANGDRAWPITGYTYLVMRKTTTREEGSCAHRQAVVKFWDWFYTSDLALELVESYGFSPLCPVAQEIVLNRLREDIYCSDGTLAYPDLEKPTSLGIMLPKFLHEKLEDIFEVAEEHAEYPLHIYINDSTSASAVEALVHHSTDISIMSDLGDAHVEEGDDTNIVRIPYIGIAFVVDFNLETAGIESLELSVDLIRDIFNGVITVWNHPSLSAMNPDLVLVNASIIVVPPSEQEMEELDLVLEARYGSPLGYTGPFSDHEQDSIMAVTIKDYSISIMHLSQHASVHVASVLGPDGETAVYPSLDHVLSCGLDTYHPETDTFVFPESSVASCYPLSIVYYIETFRDEFVEGVDSCGEDAMPVLKAKLLWWLVGEKNLDNALETAKYASLAHFDEEVHEATYERLMLLTCNGKSILTLDVNYQLLPAWSLGFSIFLAVLTTAGGLAYLAYMFIYRKNKIIRYSQPVFMGILVLGCITLTFSLIPLSLDDHFIEYYDILHELHLDQDTPGLDRACQAVPWLYCIGFAMEFSALFAKVWRLKKIMTQKKLRKIKITTQQLIPVLVGMVGLAVVVLSLWQVLAPLHWERVPVTWDLDGTMTRSYGRCTSTAFPQFFGMFVGIQLSALVYGMVLCYQTRHVQSEFMEGKWISIILVNIATTLMFSVLLGFFVKDQPAAIFAVATVNVSMLGFGVMALMCLPKCWTHYLSITDPSVLDSRTNGASASGAAAVSRIGHNQQHRGGGGVSVSSKHGGKAANSSSLPTNAKIIVVSSPSPAVAPPI